ncbi:MAG TPA: hypothetical protein VJN43_16335 [Bryobacteraceae bacterium]|nr:hypothetical protein [Bryobacteraceae bacterium]
MRPIPLLSISVVLFAAFPDSVRAQAVTEYDGIVHKSATVGGKAHHITDEINGIWGSLDKTARKATENPGSQQTNAPAKATRHAAVRSGSAAPSSSRRAGHAYADPHQIAPGISYDELVQRFGPPAFGVAAGPGAESLTYMAKGAAIDVDLRDGKVVKVTAPKPQESAAANPR